MAEPRYKYRTVAPSPLRRNMGEQMLPGHRMGSYVRIDTMLPTGYRGRAQYAARCTCRWVDLKPAIDGAKPERNYVAKRMLEMRFARHLAALKQGQLL